MWKNRRILKKTNIPWDISEVKKFKNKCHFMHFEVTKEGN